MTGMARKSIRGHKRTSGTDKGLFRVGYRRPPEETQFKLGQSGNPNGRPKRAPSLHGLLHKVLEAKVELRDGEVTKRVSKRYALLAMTVTRALKGDHQALRALLHLMLSAKLSADRQESDANEAASKEAFASFVNFLDRTAGEKRDSTPKVGPPKPPDVPIGAELSKPSKA
jgi:uncharacterized protein DUF5681